MFFVLFTLYSKLCLYRIHCLLCTHRISCLLPTYCTQLRGPSKYCITIMHFKLQFNFWTSSPTHMSMRNFYMKGLLQLRIIYDKLCGRWLSLRLYVLYYCLNNINFSLCFKCKIILSCFNAQVFIIYSRNFCGSME